MEEITSFADQVSPLSLPRPRRRQECVSLPFALSFRSSSSDSLGKLGALSSSTDVFPRLFSSDDVRRFHWPSLLFICKFCTLDDYVLAEVVLRLLDLLVVDEQAYIFFSAFASLLLFKDIYFLC